MALLLAGIWSIKNKCCVSNCFSYVDAIPGIALYLRKSDCFLPDAASVGVFYLLSSRLGEKTVLIYACF